MGSSSSTTIGYKYFMGIHMVLCHGPVDAITQIEVDGRSVWTGNETATTNIDIDKPEIFGGEQKEGGIQGTVGLMFGDAAQVTNPYFVAATGEILYPAFRGVTSIVTGGPVGATYPGPCYLTSISPYPKPWAVQVRRVFDGWYSAKAQIDSSSNPAHIIYETLTNTDWGCSIASTDIDETSFEDVADTLYDEDFGLNLILTKQTTGEDFIKFVLSHINGVLYIDPATGKFVLTLIRDDYNPATLPVFDESVILKMESFDRPSYAEMINEIVVRYRPLGQIEDSSLTLQDLAAFEAQGAVISQTRYYTGIGSTDLAALVAQRDLKQAATPLARFKFKVNRMGWDLTRGDVIKVSWPDYGISEAIVRIIRVNYGTLEDGSITVDAIEDIFGLPDSTYIVGEDGVWEDPVQEPLDAPDVRIWEAPYWALAQKMSPSALNALTSTAGFVQAAVIQPDQQTTNCELWTRIHPAVDYEYAANGQYCPRAYLLTPVQELDTAWSIDFLVGDFSKVVIGSYAYIGTEIAGTLETIRIDAINTVAGTMTVGRGCLDRLPVPHASAQLIYFADSNDVFDPKEYAASDNVYGAATIRTGIGVSDVDDSPEDEVIMDFRQAEPFLPGNLQVNTEFYFEVVVIEGNMAIQFYHRDRTQTVVLQDYEDLSTGPEAGQTYTLKIYGETDSLLRTETITPPTANYIYTEANESADGVGRYNGSLRFTLQSIVGTITSGQFYNVSFDRAGYGLQYGNYYGGKL